MDDELELLLGRFAKLVTSGQKIPKELVDVLQELVSDALGKGNVAPIPKHAGALWALADGDARTFAQYAKTYPDAEINALASNPSALKDLVGRLTKQVTIPSPEVSQGIAQASPLSSNVFGFKYDPKSGKLLVKFNGKNTRSGGPIYQYDSVPPAVWKLLQMGAVPAKTDGKNKWGQWWKNKSPSIGSSMFSLIIKGGFPYHKVS